LNGPVNCLDGKKEVRGVIFLVFFSDLGSSLGSFISRMPLIVGVGLAIFQQITGINTVIYYAPTIFGFVGFETAGSAILARAGLGILMLCVHVLAIYLMDRVGRRPLLLIGVAGQIIGLTILGAAFQFQQ
jgi:MFS family permease